jgi:subtilase family serine protease
VTDHCFKAPASYRYGSSDHLPEATYTGNVYDPSPLQCGYSPATLQAHYGLTAAYDMGLKGEGQTIVIVDAYGSPTILDDANAFSQASGLPPLTTENFAIVYPDGKPRFINYGWAIETTLDVQWAHAVAPNAKIVLVAAAGDADQEFELAENYAITHKLGSVISNSWGGSEFSAGPIATKTYDRMLALAAATGISVHFSSGDGGDQHNGTPVGAAGFPSSSPHATAVGGTSLGIPTGDGGFAEVGWGGNDRQLAQGTPSGTLVLDPPLFQGTVGSGGGESGLYPKPSWQKTLPGTGRQTPDISAIADDLTGVPVLVTLPDPNSGIPTRAWHVVGGTSLSCPVFSGIWALAAQKAGHWLGQAAPAIARMPRSAVHDIVPLGSATNVTGTIVDSQGTKSYSAADLAAPLFNTTVFFSAIEPSQCAVVCTAGAALVTFGTDTSLTTASGWDNVTGFGIPNGLTFIAAAAGK